MSCFYLKLTKSIDLRYLNILEKNINATCKLKKYTCC